jgi:hypothetical protein
MSISSEIILSNGSRLVVDNPGETHALRLIWERGDQPVGEPKRNCDLSAVDVATLMSVLAERARQVFGDAEAHGIQVSVWYSFRAPRS